MAYEKQTWINRQSQANAQRFNHMEAGIKNAYMTPLIAITNIEPSECNEGDKYFNTTDNLIYTATDTDTWSETGVAPISYKTYVLLEDGSTYMYDGTTLTRIGGGTAENEYSESTTKPYSCNYVNTLKSVYDTNEKVIGEWLGQPLYRKIYATGSLPSTAGNLLIATGLDFLNDCQCRHIYGMVRNPENGVALPLPNATTTLTSNIGVVIDTNNNIQITVGTDRSGVAGYVVLEYTKNAEEPQG